MYSTQKCQFGDDCCNWKCGFKHGPLRKLCTKTCAEYECSKVHPVERTQRCKYGLNCFRYACNMLHPSGRTVCKAGDACVEYSCNSVHPPERPRACARDMDCINAACEYLHSGTRNLNNNATARRSFLFDGHGSNSTNSNQQNGCDKAAFRSGLCKWSDKCQNWRCTLEHPSARVVCKNAETCDDLTCTAQVHAVYAPIKTIRVKERRNDANGSLLHEDDSSQIQQELPPHVDSVSDFPGLVSTIGNSIASTISSTASVASSASLMPIPSTTHTEQSCVNQQQHVSLASVVSNNVHLAASTSSFINGASCNSNTTQLSKPFQSTSSHQSDASSVSMISSNDAHTSSLKDRPHFMQPLLANISHVDLPFVAPPLLQQHRHASEHVSQQLSETDAAHWEDMLSRAISDKIQQRALSTELSSDHASHDGAAVELFDASNLAFLDIEENPPSYGPNESPDHLRSSDTSLSTNTASLSISGSLMRNELSSVDEAPARYDAAGLLLFYVDSTKTCSNSQPKVLLGMPSTQLSLCVLGGKRADSDMNSKETALRSFLHDTALDHADVGMYGDAQVFCKKLLFQLEQSNIVLQTRAGELFHPVVAKAYPTLDLCAYFRHAVRSMLAKPIDRVPAMKQLCQVDVRSLLVAARLFLTPVDGPQGSLLLSIYNKPNFVKCMCNSNDLNRFNPVQLMAWLSQRISVVERLRCYMYDLETDDVVEAATIAANIEHLESWLLHHRPSFAPHYFEDIEQVLRDQEDIGLLVSTNRGFQQCAGHLSVFAEPEVVHFINETFHTKLSMIAR